MQNYNIEDGIENLQGEQDSRLQIFRKLPLILRSSLLSPSSCTLWLKYDYVTVALHWRDLSGKFIKERARTHVRAGVYWITRLRNTGGEARKRGRKGREGWIMFTLGERLMAFIRSPMGCALELRAFSRGARDSRFFIYTPAKRPVVIGRRLFVGSQEFTTDREGWRD